jgi:hypothetical protein
VDEVLIRLVSGLHIDNRMQETIRLPSSRLDLGSFGAFIRDVGSDAGTLIPWARIEHIRLAAPPRAY